MDGIQTESKKITYSGIGSRETPQDTLSCFSRFGFYAQNLGFILRSGGADGADLAFEKLVRPENKEIYLPWEGFNKSTSPRNKVCLKALYMGAKYHPNWSFLKQGAQKLHARNCYQILGEDLKTPCDFVVCYTDKGKRGGGTGQALRIAEDYQIPIFDFGLGSHVKKELNDFILDTKNIS